MRVVVTGAAGNIAYALSFMIAQGAMFGRDRKVRGCTVLVPPVTGWCEGTSVFCDPAAYIVRCYSGASRG